MKTRHVYSTTDLDMARAAQEQRRAHILLQTLDLPADRRLGQVQFFGRLAEVQMPRHRLESAQRTH